LSHDIETGRQYKLLRKIKPDELEPQIKALKILQKQLDTAAARKKSVKESRAPSGWKWLNALSRIFKNKGKKKHNQKK
jgi:hypothetical protein